MKHLVTVLDSIEYHGGRPILQFCDGGGLPLMSHVDTAGGPPTPNQIDWRALWEVAGNLEVGESMDLRTMSKCRVDLSGLENPGEKFPEVLTLPTPVKGPEEPL